MTAGARASTCFLRGSSAASHGSQARIGHNDRPLAGVSHHCAAMGRALLSHIPLADAQRCLLVPLSLLVAPRPPLVLARTRAAGAEGRTLRDEVL